METPSVEHPKLIAIGEYTFRIMSFSPLSDEQALKAAIFFYRTHKLRKKDKKGVISVYTTFDEDSARLL